MNGSPPRLLTPLRRLALFLLTGAALALAGCATPPPKAAFYTAPTHEPAALVTVFSSPGTYLVAVDGMPVENARADSSYPIRIAPSYRALTISHAQDSLLATSEITAELKAGHAYILKAEKVAPGNAVEKGAQTDALYHIWVEDRSNGAIPGAKHLTKLNATVNDVPDPAFNAATQDFVLRLIGVVLNVMVEAAVESNHDRSGGSIVKAPPPGNASGSAPPKLPSGPAAQPPKAPKTPNAPTGTDTTPGKLKKP